MLSNRLYYGFKRSWDIQLKIRNCLSSIQNVTKNNEVQFIEKKKRSTKPYDIPSAKKYDIILNYLNSKECLREVRPKISEQFLKATSSPRSIFIVDSEVAEKLFETLKPHLESYNGHILEVNAGVGVLTKYLIDAKLARLHIYELDKMMFSHLYILKIQKDSDAELIQENLLNIWFMTWKDQQDGQNRVGEMFKSLPFLSWEDEPVFKMIVAIPNDMFLVHFMFCIIFQSGFCIYGRPQLFAIMPLDVYIKLSAKPEDGASAYKSKSVLLNVLCEHTVLDTLDAKAFMPWLRKKKRKRTPAKSSGLNPDVMYLVSITPRKDIFQTIPPDLLKAFWYYVHSTMQSRSGRIISFWEKWIPGSGVRLIKNGYTVYTKSGEITPKEHVDMFLEFSSLPEFKSSAFIPNMESLLLKMVDPGYAEEVMLENNTKAEEKEKKGGDNLVQDDDSEDELEEAEFLKGYLNKNEEEKDR